MLLHREVPRTGSEGQIRGTLEPNDVGVLNNTKWVDSVTFCIQRTFWLEIAPKP